MHAVDIPCALGFMMSSVPITAPAYLSPLAPSRLPSSAVGVRRLNEARVSALVEAASMSVAAMRTIFSAGSFFFACELAQSSVLVPLCASCSWLPSDDTYGTGTAEGIMFRSCLCSRVRAP